MATSRKEIGREKENHDAQKKRLEINSLPAGAMEMQLALPQKSRIPLDTVSTICDSGWVRSIYVCLDGSVAARLRIHLLSQMVLTVSKSDSEFVARPMQFELTPKALANFSPGFERTLGCTIVTTVKP